MNWLDYLEEAVKDGLRLEYFRQKRGYTLYFTGEGRLFVVKQGLTGAYGDKSEFTYFPEAYEWLLHGTPIHINPTRYQRGANK